MCSEATLSPSNPATTTTGSWTDRPIGATPGRKVSMTMSWVKCITISSTTHAAPTVRETWVMLTSSGQSQMKWSR